MRQYSEKQIRSCFVNVSQRERAAIPVPDVADLDWESLQFFGWRDPRNGQLGWVIVEDDDGLIGIAVRATDQKPRSRAQCSWCEDVTLPNDVVFFAARRAGAAGRAGGTVGTLACERFECTKNVRRLPPSAYLGFDREAARDRRVVALGEHVRGFVHEVAKD